MLLGMKRQRLATATALPVLSSTRLPSTTPTIRLHPAGARGCAWDLPTPAGLWEEGLSQPPCSSCAAPDRLKRVSLSLWKFYAFPFVIEAHTRELAPQNKTTKKRFLGRACMQCVWLGRRWHRAYLPPGGCCRVAAVQGGVVTGGPACCCGCFSVSKAGAPILQKELYFFA